MRSLVLTISSTLLFSVIIVSSIQIGFAEVMGSSNYQIQSDSVNIGGGFGSSDSYQLESTVGEIATGLSASDAYRIQAGFQQMQGAYIALTTDGDVNLSPTLQGVSGGYASGTLVANVVTDNPGGYTMTIEAENDPAMQSFTDTIPDLVPDAAAPDFTFSVGAAEAFFGFSPEGADIVQRYLDATGSCDQSGGSDTPDRCWDGLSTTPVTIAQSTSSNHPAGTDTTVTFQVGIGGSVTQPAGDYVATTTITVTAL